MTRVAAIDCGTNSIRLLISDIDDETGSSRDVYRTMQTVRLGEGIDATKAFSEQALARTFRACDQYADVIASKSVDAVRFVATSASRDARNRGEFIAGVASRFGVEPEVISGDEEAALTFRGALMTHGQAITGQQALVVDIGGGSTEFVRGSQQLGMIAARSVDIGCVRMTERWLHSDPPTRGEIDAATADIDAAIAQADRDVDLCSADVLIGVAGSVTTVCALALDMPTYDSNIIDGSAITTSAISEVSQSLLAMTRRDRSRLTVMHAGRVDVIGGGALILDRICQYIGGDEVLVSEHDILDGIAWSIADGRPSA